MTGDFTPYISAGGMGDHDPHRVAESQALIRLRTDDTLCDGELISIVRTGGAAQHGAIARRASLSPAVCDALAENAAPTVVAAMLENDMAHLGHSTLLRLVERSRDVIAFRVPLLRRPELDAAMAARLYTWVSPPLREFILRNFPIDAARLDNERPGSDDHEAASQPIGAPASLVECLRQGQNLSFEASFARLVGLRITAVRRILEDRAGDRLAVACRASGFTSEQFQDAYRLIQSTMARVSPRVVAAGTPRLASLYDRIDPEQARQTLKRWRREISDSPDQALAGPAALPLSSLANS